MGKIAPESLKVAAKIASELGALNFSRQVSSVAKPPPPRTFRKGVHCTKALHPLTCTVQCAVRFSTLKHQNKAGFRQVGFRGVLTKNLLGYILIGDTVGRGWAYWTDTIGTQEGRAFVRQPKRDSNLITTLEHVSDCDML